MISVSSQQNPVSKNNASIIRCSSRVFLCLKTECLSTVNYIKLSNIASFTLKWPTLRTKTMTYAKSFMISFLLWGSVFPLMLICFTTIRSLYSVERMTIPTSTVTSLTIHLSQTIPLPKTLEVLVVILVKVVVVIKVVVAKNTAVTKMEIVMTTKNPKLILVTHLTKRKAWVKKNLKKD